MIIVIKKIKKQEKYNESYRYDIESFDWNLCDSRRYDIFEWNSWWLR